MTNPINERCWKDVKGTLEDAKEGGKDKSGWSGELIRSWCFWGDSGNTRRAETRGLSPYHLKGDANRNGAKTRRHGTKEGYRKEGGGKSEANPEGRPKQPSDATISLEPCAFLRVLEAQEQHVLWKCMFVIFEAGIASEDAMSTPN